MSTLVTISRAIVMIVGAAAMLLAGGNLLTGGAPITDPVIPFGLLLGLFALGAALWTTAPERWRAVIVWLGLLAILAAIGVFAATSARPRSVTFWSTSASQRASCSSPRSRWPSARARAGPLGGARST